MKTLKIGRGSSNDIVIKDVTVSSQHAIITILDTKEVRIKDLNSTNGTFVNGKRVTGEISITANDTVKVGNTTLDWVKHLNEKRKIQPVFAGDASTIKHKKTIGRTADNDIVFKHDNVSSRHAQLIEKVNGEIIIADSGSTNGTYVNGRKISIQALRTGDSVLIANKHPLDWENVFGKKTKPESQKNLRTVFISAAAVLAAVAGIFLFSHKGTWSPEKIYAKYKKSVVLIDASYYYEVSIENEIYARYMLNANGKLDPEGKYPIRYSGTGFFVSSDGRIVTNRHIVCPWLYGDGASTMEQIEKMWQEDIAKMSLSNPKAYVKLQPLINKVKVEGKLADMKINLNDTHGDAISCVVIKESGSMNIDIGIIQTKSHTLPHGVGIENIVDLESAVIDDADIVVGKPVYTIGFPAGEFLAATAQGIEANNQDGKITQLRGEYEFGHNIPIIGGASGSPVFNEHGRLIGIIHQGFSGSQGYNMAVKARYAVELAK